MALPLEAPLLTGSYAVSGAFTSLTWEALLAKTATVHSPSLSREGQPYQLKLPRCLHILQQWVEICEISCVNLCQDGTW